MPNEDSIFSHSNRDQLHAIWIEQFKRFAKETSRHYHGGEEVSGFILKIQELDELAGDMYPPDIFEDGDEQSVLPLKSVGEIKLPSAAPQMFSFLAGASTALLDPPLSIDGVRMKKINHNIFALSDLIIAIHPKNLYTDVFKSTYAGRGIEAEGTLDPMQIIHLLGAGYGVLLLEQTRTIIDPLANNADLLEATSGMYLAFAPKP